MKYIITLALVFISAISHAQMGVDEFLELVETNNSEMLAAKKLTKAEKLNQQTGVTLDNPTVEYGYLPGNNSAIDHKTIYSIKQSFEFSTILGTRKKVANQQGELSNLEFEIYRMEKLLEAKNRFYDFIFLLKKEHEYKKRLGHATNLIESYQKQFDNGNASILDLNKSKIQFLNIKSSYELLQQDLNSIRKELALLCGTEIPEAIKTEFPLVSFATQDSIISELQNLHPELQLLKQNINLAEMQVKLARQSWIPDIELGYQGEVEQEGTFRGFVGGVSIPLWKDKNKVKYALAYADFKENQFQSRQEIIWTDFVKKYNKVKEYAKILDEFDQTLKQAANINFLNKALELGQLSVIEYFNELAFYYQSMDKQMEIELEYYKTLNQLQAYKL
ncbi:TolC family protein [Sunxiuqinia sp. A32]|uniref:TolC family protein n=1 Tax=Sunxiuqinia sp. A32 TaxID=3461496 RepID=UPI0040463A47